MDSKLLNQFHNDSHMRDAVQRFFLSQVDDLALKRLYAREDVSGIADARSIIDAVFVLLKELYDPEKKPEIGSSR